MIEQFAFSIVAGLIVGIFSGLLGIGGGTLMIPLFRLGFGLPAIVSTATSLFTIVPTSIAGCITHLKNKTCIAKIGLIAGVAGACTSPLGVLAATNSPDIAIMACAAIIIAYSAITMFRKAIKMPKRTDSDLSMRATLQRFRMEFADEAEEMPDGRQDSGERTGPVSYTHLLTYAIVRRDGKNILEVDSFVLHSGENIALLGPNGAGKSTFIRLITREDFPLYRDNPPVLFRGNDRTTLQETKKVLGVVSLSLIHI